MKGSILRKTFWFPESEYRSTTKVVKRALLCMTSLLAILFITAILALAALAKNLNQAEEQESRLLLQKAFNDRMGRLVMQVKEEIGQGKRDSHGHATEAAKSVTPQPGRGVLRFDDKGPEGVFVIDEHGHTRYGLAEGKLFTQSFQQWLGEPAGQSLTKTRQQILTRTIAVNGYPALVVAAMFPAGANLPPETHFQLVAVDKIGPDELLRLGEEYGIQQLSVMPAHQQTHQTTLVLHLHHGELTLQWEGKRPGNKILLYILPLLIVPGLFIAILALYLMRSALSKARLYDVLEQNRLALSISERRFRDVAEATSDWIWETDRELNITWLSERFPGITVIVSLHGWENRSPNLSKRKACLLTPG